MYFLYPPTISSKKGTLQQRYRNDSTDIHVLFLCSSIDSVVRKYLCINLLSLEQFKVHPRYFILYRDKFKKKSKKSY